MGRGGDGRGGVIVVVGRGGDGGVGVRARVFTVFMVEAFQPCVAPCVPGEVAGHAEGFVAVFAHVRLLAGVRAHMLGEVA